MTSVTYESHQLSLEIIQHDVDRYVEIIVKNENFTASRRSCAVKLAISVSLYLLYFITITPESMRWLHHSVFLTAMAVFGYRLLNLVENETVKIVRNLGIEMSTRYLVRRNATFIPWSNISGIVINEVIYFVSLPFGFMMIVLISYEYFF